jgi:hypothetical protein
VLQTLRTLCHRRRRRRRSRLLGSPHVEQFVQTVLRQPTKREVDHALWRCLRPTDVDAAPSSRALTRLSDTGLGASRSSSTPDHRTRARSAAGGHTPAPPRAQQVVSLGEAWRPRHLPLRRPYARGSGLAAIRDVTLELRSTIPPVPVLVARRALPLHLHAVLAVRVLVTASKRIRRQRDQRQHGDQADPLHARVVHHDTRFPCRGSRRTAHRPPPHFERGQCRLLGPPSRKEGSRGVTSTSPKVVRHSSAGLVVVWNLRRRNPWDSSNALVRSLPCVSGREPPRQADPGFYNATHGSAVERTEGRLQVLAGRVQVGGGRGRGRRRSSSARRGNSAWTARISGGGCASRSSAGGERPTRRCLASLAETAGR